MKLQRFSWYKFFRFLVIFVALRYFINLIAVIAGLQKYALLNPPANSRQALIEMAKLCSFALIFTLFQKPVVEEE